MKSRWWTSTLLFGMFAVGGALAGCGIDGNGDGAGNAVAESEADRRSQPSIADDASESIASGAVALDDGTVIVDDSDSEDIAAPKAVVAVQGPIDENHSYVAVSWSHVDIGRNPLEPWVVTGYEVARDGQVIGRVAVDEESWDDAAYRDDLVSPGPHVYQIRATSVSGAGSWSDPAVITVKSTDDVGEVFVVDDFEGSDLERAEQAVAAAEEAGGGVVLFGAGTYSFDDTLMISGSGVLLRGAGESETIIRPEFSGTIDSCGRVTPLLLFRGNPEELDVEVTDTAPRGSTEFQLSAEPPVQVGDFVEFDGVQGQLPTYEFDAMGIEQDPATGTDHRYPFDGGTVVAVGENSLTLDHPTSPIITAGSKLYLYRYGHSNGIELLTVEGGGADDRTFHRLVDASYQVDFRVADVTARWANRNFIDVSGHGITIVGFTGIDGGAAGFEPEPCKYKVGFGPASDVIVVDSTLGSTSHNRNMSLMTTQFVYRVLVRNTVFGGSRTYGFNEHGGGSRDLVVENNWIGAGPDGWAGILLGNDTWGFGGETAIRSNRFEGNTVDVLMVENPYGVVVAGNRSKGCTQACITWSGWADVGSARLVVTGNVFDAEGGGLDLGSDESNGFPWVGIRDAVVSHNVISSGEGPALRVQGDAAASGRLWVFNNQLDGEAAMETGPPGDDWWFWNNSAGPTTAEAPLPDWVDIHQWWELEGGDR